MIENQLSVMADGLIIVSNILGLALFAGGAGQLLHLLQQGKRVSEAIPLMAGGMALVFLGSVLNPILSESRNMVDKPESYTAEADIQLNEIDELLNHSLKEAIPVTSDVSVAAVERLLKARGLILVSYQKGETFVISKDPSGERVVVALEELIET